jgi:Lon protease-like protein
VTHRLPLFPLGTVLYPGLMLPLHIFEERYRALVRDLVALPEGAPRRFGVVAIRQGHETGVDGARALHEIGCTAELRQVESYDDGRFDIVGVGSTRFRLDSAGDLDESLPYLQGEVDFLEERSGEEAAVLAAGVGALFAAYRDGLLAARGESAQEALELPDDPSVLSYLVAAAMILDVPDKQRLLAAEDVATRLREEVGLLRREAAMLRMLPSLPAVDLLRSPHGAN